MSQNKPVAKQTANLKELDKALSLTTSDSESKQDDGLDELLRIIATDGEWFTLSALDGPITDWRLM